MHLLPPSLLDLLWLPSFKRRTTPDQPSRTNSVKSLLANRKPPSILSQSSGSMSSSAGGPLSVRTSLTHDSGASTRASTQITTLTGLENFEAWFVSLENTLRTTECWNLWCIREINDLEFIAASRSQRERYEQRQPTIVRNEVFHRRLRSITNLVLGTVDESVRRYVDESKAASFWTVDQVHDIVIDLFFLLLLEDAIARRPVEDIAQSSPSLALPALSQHPAVDDVMAQMQDLEERLPDSLKKLVRRRKAELSKRIDKARTLNS